MKNFILLLVIVSIVNSSCIRKGLGDECMDGRAIYQKEGEGSFFKGASGDRLQSILSTSISPLYLEILEDDIKSLEKEGEYIYIKYNDAKKVSLGSLAERNILEIYLIIEDDYLLSNSVLLVDEDGTYESWVIDYDLKELRDQNLE